VNVDDTAKHNKQMEYAKMKKSVLSLLILVLVLLLAACTPEGQLDSEAEPAAPTAEVVPDDSSPTEESAEPEQPAVPTGTVTPAPTETPAVEETPMEEDEDTVEEGASEVVEPVEVDLGNLTPEPTVVSPPQEMPLPGGINPSNAIVQEAQRDLATRLGIDISAVTIVSVVAQEWRDSSLGCPAPGMAYLTVITPGYQVVLEAQGESYTYHTDMSRNFVLCVDGKPAPSVD
jgi:hypothetical protein